VVKFVDNGFIYMPILSGKQKEK